MLLDSNIVIYAAKPESAELRSYLDRISRFVSVISYIESYGYQNLTAAERERLETIFRRTQVLPLTDPSLTKQSISGSSDAWDWATRLSRPPL